MEDKSSSTIQCIAIGLTSDVQRAVIRLKELGEQMKADAQHFTYLDLKNIDELIDNLKELDAKRLKSYYTLEAETIKSSVVRRKLETCPQQFATEIQDKVQCARDLNTEQIRTLQNQAVEIAERIAKTKKTQDVVGVHNILLESECKTLSEKNDELVKKLNDNMAKKATIQIELNETSKEFKDTVVKVNLMKKEIRDVEERMEKVMKKFTGEMHSLNKIMQDIKTKQRLTIEGDLELKMKFEETRASIGDNENDIEGQLGFINTFESEIQILLQTEISLEKKIVQGVEEIERIKDQCVAIEVEAVDVRGQYETKDMAVVARHHQFRQQIEIISAETSAMTKLCKSLKNELSLVSADVTAQEEILAEVKEKVVESKDTLIKHAEEGTDLTQNCDKLIRELEGLKRAHQETMVGLQTEVCRLHEKLDEDTKTKEVVQSGYDELTADVETRTEMHKETITNFQARTTNSRKLSVDLGQQMAELETATVKHDEELEGLDKQLEQAHENLNKRKNVLTDEINTRKENVADLKCEINDRDETLEELKPHCVLLENDHEEKAGIYEFKKKELIAIKSKKSEMDDRIKDVQRRVDSLHAPLKNLKLETLRCRAYTRQKVCQQTKEVDSLEKQVTEASRKLTAVDKENKRIVATSKELSREIERMHSMVNSSQDMEEQLDGALQVYRDKLAGHWKENEELEKTSSERDRIILNDITELRESSENRHQMIANLHRQFEEELKGFSDYLLVTAHGHSHHHS